jgi:drug/metabolite transporter (DMT)-like permease
MQKYITLAAFISLGVIWGSNFIFMKWAAEWINATLITLLRGAFGFIPLLLVALFTRSLRKSHFAYWYHFVAMSVLATTLYYFAFAKGTALLPSSVAGMLSGSIPLFTFLAALFFLTGEPVNKNSVCGILLGFSGVVLIAEPWNTGAEQVNLTGVLYMTAGALSVGISFVYARKYVKPLNLNPIALATYQTGLSLLMLPLGTDLYDIGAVFQDTKAFIGLAVGLGVFGTGIAYIIYYFLVNRMGAIAASGVTYIPPVVALLIGVLFVGESVSLIDILAMSLILIGVWRVQIARKNAFSKASSPDS